jgi:phosphoribosylanthranilate isomerase
MRVKICGITNLDDARLCCELGTDALGFIFYEKSKRFIGYDKAKKIIYELPSFVTKVGVFVNEDIDKINEVSRKIGLNMVQLHGDETPSDIDKISLPVIKALRINEMSDFSYSFLFFSKCKILLDTYSKTQPGGTGISFDWKLIPVDLKHKIILAGGISASNIEEVFTSIKPQAIDLSTSVETYPGKKDENKLRDFFGSLNQLRYKTCCY